MIASAMDDRFLAFEYKLKADGAPRILIDNFRRQYQHLTEGQTGLVPLHTLEPVPDLTRAESFERFDAAGQKALSRCVMIKLNGGLGTSMGLEKAKSLINVKRGLSFLDVLARQVIHIRRTSRVPLPFLLMNSFSTDGDSLHVLAGYPDIQRGQEDFPLSFLQHRVPKVRKDDLLPVTWPQNPEKEWCPPGHGDLYAALLTSGLLEKLLAKGFDFAFVSNCDNLGATLDGRMLGYFAERDTPFMMEVTERTEADCKGGHLARLRGGGLVLRERAQCPTGEVDDFQDIRKHRYFNTNNLWLNLRHIGSYLDSTGGVLDLPLIMNRKTVDPRDPDSPEVIQLETAMGSAISVFPGSEALSVPRTRFAPVKTTDDLLALWSDAYALTEDFYIVLHPSRKNGPPVVKLDPAHYRIIDDFLARFPSGAPSMLQCDSLTVKGDVQFGRNITLRGDVVVKNTDAMQMTIADGMTLSGS
ncbi:MAG: UTP--glucose-1-phosphate uridylyltransferase [bacterium]